MANKKNSNKISLGSSNKSRLIPALVVAAVAVVGVYLLAFSGASPISKSVKPSYVIVTDYSTAQAYSPKLTTAQDSVYYTSAPQTVIQLPVGVSANFNAQKGGGTILPTSTCYIVKALGASVQATIVSGGNQQVVSIPNDPNYYQKVCLPYITASTYPNFSIRNEAGGQLDVYQQVLEFNQG